ncbi:hypothetical protein EJ08DRAFT_634702 [Tothia fuscella]|uniref:DNA-directed DNA polymerase n=1 Tax=Tothia fuscella TaxID=1048955 RepID=A0A9P4TYG6_9PEZI|nr:hypothetical protein EJ08DRAFT_634702 [Tothia fuscella]
MAKSPNTLLQIPSEDAFPSSTRIPSIYNPLDTFALPKGDQKHYTQQFADLYFLRLALLKPDIEKIAEEAWKNFELGGERAAPVERVLDVRQGELCWMVGTVYMEMSLKPNVLDDISKEHWIVAPPTREKYISSTGGDRIYLEDESGRLALTGEHLKKHLLVTGCIIATMGTENAQGEFEVVDVKVADLPRQPDRWESYDSAAILRGEKVNKKSRPKSGKVALVSGLEFKGDGSDSILLDLLTEYLLGETGTDDEPAQISRLIIAGNSLSHSAPIESREEHAARPLAKRFGHDTIAYNPVPSTALDLFLAQLLPSLPITILPGDSDPSSIAIPQQPLHPALFPHSRSYANILTQEGGEPSWFHSVTNPWEGDIDGLRFLGNGGQPINDMYKYVKGSNRLRMMEHLLRWRNNAPTAPDTLWTFPFQDNDPFIMRDCPHVFFAGNQPRFATSTIEGPVGQQVRLIAVPNFKETSSMVLLDIETMEVECVKFRVLEKKMTNGN